MNGSFHVREAYIAACGHDNSAEEKYWGAFWRVKRPARYGFTAWQARHDKLLTNSLLFSRNCTDYPSCPVFGAMVKSTLHAVQDCSWEREACRKVVHPSKCEQFMGSSCVKDRIDTCLARNFGFEVETWDGLFRVLVTAIWHNRNRFVFFGEEVSSVAAVQWTLAQVREWHSAHVNRKIELQDVFVPD